MEEKSSYERVCNTKLLPRLTKFTDVTVLHFSVCGWVKSEVNKRKVDTPDELLACILDAAACIKLSEDQHRRTTGDRHTPVAKCIEVDGGDFSNIYCDL